MITTHLRTSADYLALNRARSLLGSSSIAAMRGITVVANSDGIVICGKVNRYYYKQLAQELVRRVIDSAPLSNQIEVAVLD